MSWDIVTSCLGGRHTYFWYNATFGDNVDNTIEQLAELRKHENNRLKFATMCPRTQNMM